MQKICYYYAISTNWIVRFGFIKKVDEILEWILYLMVFTVKRSGENYNYLTFCIVHSINLICQLSTNYEYVRSM